MLDLRGALVDQGDGIEEAELEAVGLGMSAEQTAQKQGAEFTARHGIESGAD